MKKISRNGTFLTLSISALALSACSTQNASRYGDGQVVTPSSPCGAVTMPCGQVIQYRPVLVTPPPYIVPASCPDWQCPQEPPVVLDPPYVPQVVTHPPYVPPAMPEPPIVLPPPPVISCPEGTIPGYGGQDCIPITIPRK